MNEERRIQLVKSKRKNFRTLIVYDYSTAIKLIRNFEHISIELTFNENFEVSILLNKIEDIIFFFQIMRFYLKKDLAYYI